MRKLKLNAVAALFAAAALAACGGGGGGELVSEAPPPAPSPGPAPGPAPAPGPGPGPAPAPAPQVAPPVNMLSSDSANVLTDATLTFNVANGYVITVDDPDSSSLTVSLTLTAGTLSMAGGSGATITGDDTSNVTVAGTIAQINAALDGMRFTAPSAAQTITLQVTTQDASTPAPLEDSDQLTINVSTAPPPEFQNFQSASDVIGQAAFDVGGSGAPTNRNLLAPKGAVALNATGRIYVPDAGHNRVLVFPAGSGIGDFATMVLGQSSMTTDGSRVEQGSHPLAAEVSIRGDRMAVAEPTANRVSLYSTVPTAGADRPDVVLGQTNFRESREGCFGDTLTAPESVVVSVLGKLVVADTGNNRVNIYHRFPGVGENAPVMDVHLGQPTMGTCRPNMFGTPGQGTLNGPRGVWTNGNRVVVADTGNNRVMIWTTFPSPSKGQLVLANRVLGQADFTSVQANRGGMPGNDTLNAPAHVASDGTRLAVADTGNHRVLIWTSFPTADGVPAQVVLGQSDFTKALPNDSVPGGGSEGPSDRVFFSPTGLVFRDGKLYVTDHDNNRVLIFEPQ